MLKNYATIVELNITMADFVFDFCPQAGVWISPINEKSSTACSSYFSTIYNVEIENKKLLDFQNIGGISVNNDRGYVEVFSWQALYEQYKSFYIFSKYDILYIAINFYNFEMSYKKDALANQKKLYSNRTWINNNGIETNIFANQNVIPIIENIDTADIEGDALTFDTIQTNEMSVTLLNHDGRFDNFDNLYGNRFLVYQQYDYDDKSKIVFSGFIEKPEFNFLDTVTITASDIRHSYSSILPVRSFNLSDYPKLEKFPENVDSGKNTIDTKRTLAAGKGIIVKCIPIKYFAGDINDPYNIPEIIFEICDTTNHGIENIVSKPDKYNNNIMKPHVFFIEKSQGESITHNGVVISGDIETFIPEYKDYGDSKGNQKVWAIDKQKGTLTFRGEKQVKTLTIGDNSDDIVEIFIEIDIPPYRSLELIKEILANYENISYIKENYNIENYEAAKIKSREIAVSLTNDEPKSILDLIGELSFLEQGRLEIENNLITFNSTKDRIVQTKLNQNKMGRVDKTVESDEYLSSCSVGYDSNKYRYENKQYEKQAKKRHRLNAHEDFDTLLKNKSDAEILSNEIMKARYTLKYYYTFEYFETLDNLKLFDLVEFEYRRENGEFFINPCICEIVKINIFDDIIKLRLVE